MLLALLPVMEMISVVPPFDAAWPDRRDRYDQPVWTAAHRTGASFVISHDVNDFPPRDRDGRCRHAGIESITAEHFLRQVVRLDPEYLLLTGLPDGRVRHERQVRSSTGA